MGRSPPWELHNTTLYRLLDQEPKKFTQERPNFWKALLFSASLVIDNICLYIGYGSKSKLDVDHWSR